MYHFYDPERRVAESRAVFGDVVERHRQIPIETADVRRAAEVEARTAQDALAVRGDSARFNAAAAAVCAVHLVSQRWGNENIAGHTADATVSAVALATQTVADDERGAQAALVRDIFRNPWRPLPPLSPSLLTSNGSAVVRLAGAASEQRSFPAGRLDTARLVVPADALDDADRTDAALLAHLPSPGLHGRGCHALDWVLRLE
jgi:hypothetical protein